VPSPHSMAHGQGMLSSPPMSALDIVIAALVAICSVFGLVRGFVRIAIGVAGLLVSLALSLRFAAKGTEWFGGVISSPELARLAAFVLLLLAGLVATGIVGWIVWRVVRAAHIDWIDRLAGGFVGFLGATFITCGLLVALTTFLPSGSPFLTSSRLVPIAIRIADIAATVLPPEMAETYRERRRALEPLSAEGAGRSARALSPHADAGSR